INNCLKKISSTIPDTNADHIPITLSHVNVNKCSFTKGTTFAVYMIYPIAIIKVNIQAIGLLNASEFIPKRCSINFVGFLNHQKTILLVNARDNPPSTHPVVFSAAAE